MKISEIYRQNKTHISFEIFPPKGEFNMQEFENTLGEMKEMNPAFIGVTYSAGGSGKNDKTVKLSHTVKEKYGIEVSAHLTCINSDRQEIDDVIAQFKENGIENILALRGDKIEGNTKSTFKYASELIPIVKDAGFCVGAACYPEGHVGCKSMEEDVHFLIEKQNAGADFFISQLFMDNNAFYKFIDVAEKEGITKPITPGIMPMLGHSQATKMLFMCGASIPAPVVRLLNRYQSNPADLRKAGIEYAANQVRDLIENGFKRIHIYTMNHPEIAKYIKEYNNV